MKPKGILLIALWLMGTSSWCQQTLLKKQTPKRFIDKVEVVVGAGLCFNRGNMFVENSRLEFANGNFVTNKRLPKMAYSFGIGVYHPVTDRLDVNARLLWERKGYRSELQTALGLSSRAFATSDYTYTYFTLPVTARLFFDNRKKIAISFGGYFSQFKDVSVTEKFYNTLDFTRSSTRFAGRTLVGFDANGGINSAAFLPGVQSFMRYDFGATVGLSYHAKVGVGSDLLIQMTANTGLANVNNKEQNFTGIPSPTERNQTVIISVGYVYKRRSKNKIL